ncbi:MAG: PD-(D/E)XK nuclease family protein [Elusimicrobia bacterium]|nr:PD-(D/E)XK nuclease family protein [Elusimicrobiota bacterium]
MDLPRPLSHSSISMYGECPKKYWFRYIERIPEKPKHYFSYGRSMHSALEFFYGAEEPVCPSLDDLLKAYKARWVAEGYRDAEQERTYFEDGKAILIAFYHKHAGDFAPPLAVEHSFQALVEGVPVTGVIDRIDELPDGTVAVLDYKTGKAIAKDRVASDPQLTMYQLACEGEFDCEVGRLSFYHLPSLTTLDTGRHGQDKVDSLKRRIVDTAADICAERFDPRPEEKKCMWCDYKPFCPVFKHQFPPSPARDAGKEPEPPVEGEAGLARLADRYGELRGEIAARGALKEALAKAFKRKGYVKAFGKRFEARVAWRERWEFPDREKAKDLIKKAGLWDSVLTPMSVKVNEVLEDPGLDPGCRARLEGAGSLVLAVEFAVKPVGRAGPKGAVPPATSDLSADDDEQLAEMIDRYGELESLKSECKALESRLSAALREKGCDKACGQRFEVAGVWKERYEFPDRGRLADLARAAGLLDRIMVPSQALVQGLMKDPAHRATLEPVARRTEVAELEVSPVAGAERRGG